ncbi:MAG: hypothetical protein ACT4ON_10380 [Bacteroidota bacterium]
MINSLKTIIDRIMIRTDFIISTIILLLFAVWWATNVFFTLPDSSLPIVVNKNAFYKFDTYFYQRWGFFAPPPKSDDRLYYVYINNVDSSINVLEVTKKLVTEKNKMYLTNDKLAIQDYILFNLEVRITDFMRQGYELLENKHKLTNSGLISYKDYLNKIRTDVCKNEPVKIMIKHATLLAKTYKIDLNCKIQIVLNYKELPRFKDRYKENKNEETNHFKSDYYNFKAKKWENYIEL